MISPAALGCPPWEYSTVPGAAAALQVGTQAILTSIADGDYDALVEGTDTRPVHRRLFGALTPTGFEYYAGNYRGSEFACLEGYRVGVGGDPAVGADPADVAHKMAAFAETVATAVRVLDAAADPQTTALSPEDHLLASVAVAARAFHEFLTIHPYADGNGHTSRFLVVLLLMRHGYRPERWTIDPRPAVRDYGAVISEARRGHPQRLEHIILSTLIDSQS